MWIFFSWKILGYKSLWHLTTRSLKQSIIKQVPFWELHFFVFRALCNLFPSLLFWDVWLECRRRENPKQQAKQQMRRLSRGKSSSLNWFTWQVRKETTWKWFLLCDLNFTEDSPWILTLISWSGQVPRNVCVKPKHSFKRLPYIEVWSVDDNWFSKINRIN